MKPQFANVFNVSVNDNRSECSLSFYHTPVIVPICRDSII